MRKDFKFILFCVCTIASSVFCSPPEGGGIEGSGTPIVIEKPISGFTKIDAGFGITQLTIKQGDEYQVILNIDQKFAPYLHVSKSDKTLTIYLEENRMDVYEGEFQVEITMPMLEEVVLLSVLDTKIAGFEDMHEFRASLYSSSKLEGDFEVNTLELQVFSHSEVTLVGSADHVKIRAAETGRVFLTEFPVQTASVDAKSGSTVKLNVQEQLEVIAAENAKVYYLGKPLVNAETDDTSQIEPME